MECAANEKVAAILRAGSRAEENPQQDDSSYSVRCRLFTQQEIPMSFNLAEKTLAERAEIEDEKSRLFELWQTNLGKAKGEAARLFGERAKRKGKWAEWVRAELDGMSPPEFSNMVRSEVNRLMAAAK
jgi:hypothetical protein